MGITQVRKGTYQGRRAESWEDRETANPAGPRWVFTRWIDDATEANGGYPAGTVTVKKISGDGRYGATILEPERVIKLSEEDEA